MSRRRSCFASVLAFVLMVMLVSVGSAQVFTTLFDFNGTDGANPTWVILAQGRDGQLYGTTSGGGTNNFGNVFRVDTNGNESVLYNFDATHGKYPAGGLTLASDGYFYGTTQAGGTFNAGVLFKISASGNLTVLYNFAGSSDCFPDGPPMEALDGNMYGTTQGNGSGYGGEVYKFTRSGVFTVIYDFTNTGASVPISPVIRASDGTLYGTASEGGRNGYGMIFKMTTSGAMTREFSLAVKISGGYPQWPLIQASDGNFYGVTDGSYLGGDVFQITQNGTFSVLYHQQIGSGSNLTITNSGVVQATDGNLYGLALGGGASGYGGVYQLTLDGGYSDVYDFSTFEEPRSAMMQHTNGKLYGTMYRAATNGSVYSFDMGLGPFIAFVRYEGRAGSTAEILGQGLTGATGVTFNGVAATSCFTVGSDTFMTAVVPSGATTGPVVVTTIKGTLNSNHNFQIVR